MHNEGWCLMQIENTSKVKKKQSIVNYMFKDLRRMDKISLQIEKLTKWILKAFHLAWMDFKQENLNFITNSSKGPCWSEQKSTFLSLLFILN